MIYLSNCTNRIMMVLMVSIMLVSLNETKSGQQYETELSFVIEIERPFKYFWIVLDGEYQGEKYAEVGDRLLEDVKKIKGLVDKQNQRKIGTNANGTKLNNSDLIKLLTKTNQSLDSEKHQFTLQPSFAQQPQSLTLQLSELQIQLNPSIKLYKTLFIRLSSDRKSLASFVDQLQLLVSNSNGLQISTIEKASKDYYGNFIEKDQCFNDLEQAQNQKCKKIYKQRMLEDVDLVQLEQKITEKAQNYCKGLGMKLEIVDNYDLINYDFQENQDLQREKEQSNGQEDDQSLNYEDQMIYTEAYEIKNYEQNFEYENLFFEINATCTGIRKFSKKNFSIPQNSRKSKVSSQKFMTGADLEKEIHKLKNIKKSKK